jgi:signal transduction histidine kinase
MDAPIALSQLLDVDQLAGVLGSIEGLHPVTIEVRDRKGVLLSRGPEIDSEQPQVREDIQYNGDIVGRVLVGARGEGDADLSAVAVHAASMVSVLIHSSYARHLTTTIHEAAMEESFAELSDRNTRLASAIERLEELESLKSNFLATISHELRTPLTSIIGYSEMLNEGLAGELTKDQKEYAETILSKSEHLLQLITGILDVSLIEARSLRLNLKPTQVGKLISSVATSMKKDFKRRNIVLELPSDAVPEAMVDSAKMRQVVLHLLANAIKFSPEGGDVKVTLGVGPLSPDDTSSYKSPLWRDRLSERFGLRVTVRDQGIGIPGEKLASIFEPFYQVDSGSTRAFGGTGLGLSLAKSLVIAHGGFLWVESTASEKGSAFVFTLPAVAKELSAYIAHATSTPPPPT